MIKIYPVTIEAYDTEFMDKPLFTISSFDECTAQLAIDTLVTEESLDELFQAIRESVKMMDLEKAKP